MSTTDPRQLKFWRELHDGYAQTGFGYDVICRQFKEALNEIDRLNALIQRQGQGGSSQTVIVTRTCQVEHVHWEGPMVCGNPLPCHKHGG